MHFPECNSVSNSQKLSPNLQVKQSEKVVSRQVKQVSLHANNLSDFIMEELVYLVPLQIIPEGERKEF